MNIIANISIALGLCSAAIIAIDLTHHAQRMKIMNAVWVLTGLWAGVIALWAYFAFGRERRVRVMDMQGGSERDMNSHGMDMHSRHPHNMDNASKGMKMQGMNMKRPYWQSVTLSTLHCGAGCTLADIIGELLLIAIPVTIAGSHLYGGWVVDYILALFIGVCFQYSAIRQMNPAVQRMTVLKRAVKADFLSLTAWQIGMYAWMALVVFVLFAGGGPARDSAEFWFMMQIAMMVGFVFAYPVNIALIKYGVKSAM